MSFFSPALPIYSALTVADSAFGLHALDSNYVDVGADSFCEKQNTALIAAQRGSWTGGQTRIEHIFNGDEVLALDELQGHDNAQCAMSGQSIQAAQIPGAVHQQRPFAKNQPLAKSLRAQAAMKTGVTSAA